MVDDKTFSLVYKYAGLVVVTGIMYRTFGASIANAVLENIGLKPISPFNNSDILTQLIAGLGALMLPLGGKQYFKYKENCNLCKLSKET